MHIEHSLAAKQIAKMLAQGYGRQACINGAYSLVKSQAFGAKYSREVAEQMFDLVA